MEDAAPPRRDEPVVEKQEPADIQWEGKSGGEHDPTAKDDGKNHRCHGGEADGNDEVSVVS